MAKVTLVNPDVALPIVVDEALIEHYGQRGWTPQDHADVDSDPKAPVVVEDADTQPSDPAVPGKSKEA